MIYVIIAVVFLIFIVVTLSSNDDTDFDSYR